MKKQIIAGLAAVSVASVALAVGTGAFRTIVVTDATEVTVNIEPLVDVVTTPETDRVEVSSTRVEGTLDTAAWGEWDESGAHYGGEVTKTVTASEPVVETTGGVLMTYQVQEGDFMVTYSYTTEIVKTTTTPQTETTNTAAVMQDQTRECVVTVNGVADLDVPTCE